MSDVEAELFEQITYWKQEDLIILPSHAEAVLREGGVKPLMPCFKFSQKLKY